MRNSRIKIIERQSGDVAVTLSFNPIHIKKLKEIRGHRWNPEEKCWIFHHSENVVKRLLDILKSETIWPDASLKQDVGQIFTRCVESRKNGSRKLHRLCKNVIFPCCGQERLD